MKKEFQLNRQMNHLRSTSQQHFVIFPLRFGSEQVQTVWNLIYVMDLSSRILQRWNYLIRW